MTTKPEIQFTIRAITANLIDHFWRFTEPYIKRALDHASGEFKPDDLKRLCKDRCAQLWLVSEGDKIIGACTTELIDYPQRRHCRVITLAGSKAPEWTSQLDEILYNWAKQQGCQGIEAYVRKGYVPVLAKYGYVHKYSAVFKEIVDDAS